MENGSSISIWLDKDFGDGDLIAIDKAITQWNFALNGNIRLEFGGREDWVFLVVRDGSGLSWAGTAEIYFIRERIQNEEMAGIVLHQVGNLLGATMPEWDWEHPRCLDYEIMLRVSRARGIPMERLNYCVYE